MLYPVNEIFYSIQGEGFHTGTPAVFIRLAGCNLKCPWCDTNHKANMAMDEHSIIKEVKKACPDPPLIVVTGGEPTIHELEPLLRRLETDMAAIIAIESNGTNPETLARFKSEGLLDWITVSPKAMGSKLSAALYADEIKIVLDGNINPLEYAFRFKKSHLYIQPCSEDFQPAVDYVLQNPRWRLSVQTQKVIGVK